MEKFAFYKYSAGGNDFVIVDNWDGLVPEKDMGKIARLMCREKFGIGANGAAFIIPGPDEVDFAGRFFNSDGSEADICGNAARCAAHLANTAGIAPAEMSFKTRAGVVEAAVNERLARVTLPKIGRSEGAALVEAEGISLTYHRINVGVPHAVAWVEDLESLSVPKLGRAVRRHPAFAPDGYNINFAKIIGPAKMAIRTYERGVEDEIPAPGGGAVAAMILAAREGLLGENPVTVKTRGGEEITAGFSGSPENPEGVFLEGRVRYLFSGQVEADLFLK